jgi:putative phage-type endonuclease
MLTAEVLAKTNKLDRTEWLKLRRQGLGGSDAAAAAGLNKWKSPLALWMEKTGQVEPPEPGEAAYWGTMLEDVVAREFSRQTGLKVKRKNALLQHYRYHHMLANVDRLVAGQEAGLECKTTGQFNKDDWEEKRIPYEYILQCQHYLAVTGYKTWYIAVLIGGNKFIWREIKRDQQIIDCLIQIETCFWHHVVSGHPPVPDGTESSSEVLKLLYPQSVPESKVQLPELALELVETYDRAREAEEKAQEEKEQAANRLKMLLGKSETGLIGDRQVNWKTVESARLDTKALKEEHPDIYTQYAKINSTRRFTVK